MDIEKLSERAMEIRSRFAEFEEAKFMKTMDELDAWIAARKPAPGGGATAAAAR